MISTKARLVDIDERKYRLVAMAFLLAFLAILERPGGREQFLYRLHLTRDSARLGEPAIGSP